LRKGKKKGFLIGGKGGGGGGRIRLSWGDRAPGEKERPFSLQGKKKKRGTWLRQFPGGKEKAKKKEGPRFVGKRKGKRGTSC